MMIDAFVEELFDLWACLLIMHRKWQNAFLGMFTNVKFTISNANGMFQYLVCILENTKGKLKCLATITCIFVYNLYCGIFRSQIRNHYTII